MDESRLPTMPKSRGEKNVCSPYRRIFRCVKEPPGADRSGYGDRYGRCDGGSGLLLANPERWAADLTDQRCCRFGGAGGTA